MKRVLAFICTALFLAALVSCGNLNAGKSGNNGTLILNLGNGSARSLTTINLTEGGSVFIRGQDEITNYTISLNPVEPDGERYHKSVAAGSSIVCNDVPVGEFNLTVMAYAGNTVFALFHLPYNSETCREETVIIEENGTTAISLTASYVTHVFHSNAGGNGDRSLIHTNSSDPSGIVYLSNIVNTETSSTLSNMTGYVPAGKVLDYWTVVGNDEVILPGSPVNINGKTLPVEFTAHFRDNSTFSELDGVWNGYGFGDYLTVVISGTNCDIFKSNGEIFDTGTFTLDGTHMTITLDTRGSADADINDDWQSFEANLSGSSTFTKRQY